MPRYREMNPGVFAIITFPFLFGVMFGDMLHGSLALMLGLFLVYCNNNSKKIKNESLKQYSAYGYLLSIMAFFSLFCGFMYNDFTSLTFNFFGSCYDVENFHGKKGEPVPKTENCVYKFGLDPVWLNADNELIFINSLKMKLSVVIGVI